MEYEIELKYNFIQLFVCNKYWLAIKSDRP